MRVDIYAHIIPPKIKDLMFKKDFPLVGVLRSVPTLYDLEARFRIMDRSPDELQVLTLPGASVDDLVGPKEAVDLAKRINDEMAEIVYMYPDRFAAGVAVLPMSDIDAALTEIDRAIRELKLRGILLRIPTHGKPVDRAEFMPIYEKMCQYNLPIWFHPERSPKIADYADESESKYLIWHLWGLLYETTISMTRLVFSGVLEKYPKIKIITHHCGAMVPFFSERIVNNYNRSEMRDKKNFTAGLTEPPIEYFRRFYNDTAIQGNTPALMCAYHFFGAEHLLFGTDMPFDAQLGDYSTKRTIQAIEQMDIPDADKKKIFEDNARQLVRLPI
jgi:predicted TIM-barrel fold metal-dependent hydrolase